MVCILIGIILVISNESYCGTTNTGNHYYKLWKDYESVVINKKNKTDFDTIMNVMKYQYFCNGFIYYCKSKKNNCLINEKYSNYQIMNSFGKYLENHPLERDKNIQVLLFEWEMEKFGNKDN